MTRTYLVLAAFILSPLSAHATAWNLLNTANCLNGCTANYPTYSPTSGNSQAFSSSAAGAPNLTVSAFSTSSTSATPASTFAAATLALYSGYGLGATAASNDGTLGSQPDHAFDNDGSASTTTDYAPDGNVDAALLYFGPNGVDIDSLSVGYIYGDADISVLAYTGSLVGGALPAAAAIANHTFAQLLSAGWSFIGNYNMGSTNTAKAINSDNVSSSYWLISAYTTSAGTGKGDSTSLLSFGNDYFKLSAVSGIVSTTTGSVPEPASALLIALGLLGFRARMRDTRGNLLIA
ncbi:exosortase-dependent surface protein XDP1 [Methylomonas sp. UP202]|uniref:exosortase-dependent surface protein XDP1 n=1 Tax=Methylomonas sp. UP202 TaxID=3040943 RepID=UPI0024795F4D|nr:exosortase-dependent surface protein XDP1 [Methylomonas sp. UP202]WGS87562.1 PEP-CTERM sorting domain-containing protein [Methylomonas sp. UP202]